MKGQVLADFVTDFSPRSEMEVICHVDCYPWKVFVDEASNVKGLGVGGRDSISITQRCKVVEIAKTGLPSLKQRSRV